MADDDRHELTLTFDANQLRALRACARSDGREELSDWARAVLLEAAKARAASIQAEADPAAKEESKAARPKCGCGATSNPSGDCDLSCLSRY